MIVFRGVAPVYKPGNLATGQCPQADYGYVSPDKTTAYCEYSVFPDYEKYTNDQKSRYDILYELKVDGEKAPYTGDLPVPVLVAAPTLLCRLAPAIFA